MSASNRSRFISKSWPSENFLGSMSTVTPVFSMSVVQWRGRSASFLRLEMSGRLWVKPSTTSSTYMLNTRNEEQNVMFSLFCEYVHLEYVRLNVIG